MASADSGSPPESAPESIGRPTRWFVDITSWEPITMDLRQLVRAFAAGRIDADTLIWCKGMPDWRRLRDVDELAERLLAIGPNAGLRSSRPLSSRPPANPSELPPPVAPSRSRTPQASYYVPSAGDTIPLQRMSSSDPPGAEVSASLSGDLKGPSLLDELEPTTSAASEGSPTNSQFPADLELEASEAAAPITLDATPEAADAEPVAAAVNDESKPRSNDGKLEIGAHDVSAALAEAALFATPDSVRPVAAKSEAGSAEVSASGAPSKSSTTDPPPSQPAASQPAASQPAASQPAAGRSPSRDGAGAEPRPRAARNRRRSSSEETPAQKPSSLSVPPRAARSHRGRALVAVCGTLALIWFVGRATMEQSTKSGAVNEAPSASEPSAPLEPVGPNAATRSNDASAASGEGQRAEQHAARQTERVPEVEAHPLQPPQAQATSALQPAQPPKVDAKAAAAPPTPPAAVSVKPAAVASKPPPARPAAPAAVRAPVAPAVPAAAIAAPTTAAVQPPAKPAPFDMERAEQQMMLAAQAAASCGQAGPQRGAGQVKVLVEPWGRVVRVTHLEQGFVGTPVGICVMQAYQQLQVSPFEGGTRSLIGSFDVK
ncbi:MAG: GYF domain-containing protein [Polyangiaceae bacterium]